MVKSRLSKQSTVLEVGVVGGRFIASIPFSADYISIQNLTAAVTLHFEEGELFSRGAEAIPVEAGAYISTRMRETQKVTVFWTSSVPTVQGDVIALQFSDEFIPIQAGSATVTDVNVTALPAIPAGANAIGTVGVTALPAIPAGANAIGTVGVTALPAIPAGANAIGTVGVTALPAIPAGANAIGTVGVTALPAIPAGANTIGIVVNVSGTQTTEITTATTTAIKAAAGVVGCLVNTGAAISGAITIYDSLSASGKKVWAGTLAAGAVLALNLPCALGITIVTAAADTLLVSWN